MKRNIILFTGISILVLTSIIISEIVLYSATRPDRLSVPERIVAPVSVKPESSKVTDSDTMAVNASTAKIQEKVIETYRPKEEELIKKEPQDARESTQSVSSQEKSQKAVSSDESTETTLKQVTTIGLSILPVGDTGKPAAQLPPFTPVTNTIGPVAPSKEPLTLPISSAPTSSQSNSEKDIGSFIAQLSATGPIPEEGHVSRPLPPFTPVTNNTGPVPTSSKK